MDRADAILDQLRVRIRAGEREATIQLNPVELGRMRMHVRVDGGAISATIAAESAETLAVLVAHAPELRSWLARDGSQSVELEFELMTSDDADERSNFERSDAEDRPRGRRVGGQQRTETASAVPAALVESLASRSADGGVDLVA